MKSYKWGVIGPGDIAHSFANDLKLVNGDQRIQAVLSHKVKSADDFADEFKIPGRFTNLEDFIQKSQVDIVYISTPHSFHFEQIKACLTNKIPVICEKPIVLNKDQHQELLNLSKEENTFLMEGMWIRFLPSILKLLELIEQKKIGEIIQVKASMCFKANLDERNRFYDPEKGGGSLLDLGVYCVFLSTLLFGKPESIKAVGRLSNKNIDEACGILLSYSDGRYSILESSLLKNKNGPAEIYGKDGMIRILDPWFEKSPGLEIEMNNGEKEEIPLTWAGHGLQYEIEEVIKCLEKEEIESALMTGRLSNEVLEIMDEIRNQIHVIYENYE